ncbi:acireductone synthase [Amycolatopsis pretoriensis]|uniref:acireductone synthase n=1 Tax=Amycolatopsis pretoriensis TaxID=218821 RepID=UPI001ABFF01D|nr:acireductone synthase [Amycolatopsis pretoriensis]
MADIEGTTSRASHVREKLFPYARQRLAQWVRLPEAHEVVAEVRAHLGDPDAGADEVTQVLLAWHDADEKVPPLKTLQGMIWAAGYERGELTAHVYDDVPPAFRRWSTNGEPVYIYSSGSVAAQQAWFAHTQHGDLTGHVSGYFDTVNGGPKKKAGSYLRIAGSLGVPPSEILFLSDDTAEVAAARRAGLRPVHIAREDSPVGPDSLNSFDSILALRV